MINFKLLSLVLASGFLLTTFIFIDPTGTVLKSKSDTTRTRPTTTTTEKKEEAKTYKLGEEWVVDGQWKLKINSVTTTEKRNKFSEDKPVEVVVIDYTYENIGYETETQEGLYLSPSNVIDGGKKVVKLYPAGVKDYPQETPKGTISENVQLAYGLKTASDEITVVFDRLDGNKKPQRAEFKVPVKK